MIRSQLAALGLGAEVMVRVNDPRRDPATVKQDVLPYCSSTV